MDEIEKIRAKNSALIKARTYLLNQTPSDMVAIADITESIIDLTGRHLAAADAPKIPKVTTTEQRLLREAIQALDKNVKKKAPASQILSHAKAIYALRPWPPRSKALSRGGVSATRPWPNRGRAPATKPWPPS